MTRRILLASLAAGVLAAPVLVHSPPAMAEDLAIGSIRMRPAAPVVTAEQPARMVIEVTARGASGPDGVRISVRPAPVPQPGVDPGATQSAEGVEWPMAAPDRPYRQGQRGRKRVSLTERDPRDERRWDAEGQVPSRAEGRPAVERYPQARSLSPARPPGRPYYRVGTSIDLPAPERRERNDWEVWRFLPTGSLDRRHPTGRWTVTAVATGEDGRTVTAHTVFYLRRETRFSEFTVDPQADGVRISGVLDRLTARPDTDFVPFPGRRVEILRRAADGVQWTRLATVVTDGEGRFSGTVAGSEGALYRVRFAGTDYYAPVLSNPVR